MFRPRVDFRCRATRAPFILSLPFPLAPLALELRHRGVPRSAFRGGARGSSIAFDPSQAFREISDHFRWDVRCSAAGCSLISRDCEGVPHTANHPLPISVRGPRTAISRESSLSILMQGCFDAGPSIAEHVYRVAGKARVERGCNDLTGFRSCSTSDSNCRR